MPTLQTLALDGPLVAFGGAIGLQHQADGVQPWRVRVADLTLHHRDVLGPASCPSGVRLRLRSNTRSVHVWLVPADVPGAADPRAAWCELSVNGVVRATCPVATDGRVRFAIDPDGQADLDVWLPTSPGLRVRSLVVDADACVEPPRPERGARWAVYGSSITQGAGMPPTRTWSMRAAAMLHRRIYNLGLDGNAHLDPLVAAAMADLPLDRLTLAVGINVHLGESLTERTFAPAVHGFIDRIRLGHPTAPIVLVSPLISPAHDDVVPRHGLSLARIRTELRECVRRRADPSLHFLDGRTLLTDPIHLPDGLHPSPAGHRELARRYVELEPGSSRAT